MYSFTLPNKKNVLTFVNPHILKDENQLIKLCSNLRNIESSFCEITIPYI